MLKIIVKAVFKSIGWNFFGITMGLLQLILLWLYTSLGKGTLELNKVLMDGVVLFFCSAFVFASVIEYFCMKERYAKLFEAFFFLVLPLTMIIFIVVLYFAIIEFAENINMDILSWGTYICFIIAVFHSLVFRSIRNYSEMKGEINEY